MNCGVQESFDLRVGIRVRLGTLGFEGQKSRWRMLLPASMHTSSCVRYSRRRRRHLVLYEVNWRCSHLGAWASNTWVDATGFQIILLVLHTAPDSLDEDIVDPASFAIHADRHARFPQNSREGARTVGARIARVRYTKEPRGEISAPPRYAILVLEALLKN
jgi:hypothetical protein